MKIFVSLFLFFAFFCIQAIFKTYGKCVKPSLLCGGSLLPAPLFGGLVVLGEEEFVEVSYVVVADGVSNFVDVFVGRS